MRLSFMGYNTFAFSDNHIELIKANLIKENDVVIGLSVSVKTIDTIKHLEIAKNRGATIIGITNYRTSKISDLSDYTLLTASKDVLAQGTSLITQTSQLIV
ncbi:SIS domain-containing protein [Paraclostridium sordellii]